jgi:hypothetical protein
MAERGKKLSGALRRDPKNKPTERLSPGVYRGAGGGLVTQGGKPIQRQPQAPAMQPQRPMPTSLVGESNFTPEQLRDFANRFGNGAGARIGEIAGNIAADQQIDPGYFNPELQQVTNRVQNILANQQPQSGYMPNTQGTTPPGWNNLTSNPGASVPQFDPNNPGQIQNGLGQPMTMPQMPQASANQGGRYRLSPGVYGTQQQAMNQYNQQMQQFNARLPQQLMKKY